MSTPTQPGRPAPAPVSSAPVPAGATPMQPAKRGRKAGSQAKIRQAIPADQFKMETVAPDKRGLVRRVRVARSEQQKAMDQRALVLHQLWVDSGKPTDWLKMPVKTWPLETRYLDDGLFLLRKACALHGFKLHLGDIQTTEENGVKISRIPIVVRDRRADEAEEIDTEDSDNPGSAAASG
jgi:hypothetical protein